MIGISLLALAGALQAGTAPDVAYRTEVENFRRDRATRLSAPDGWLSLVGLFWLEPGANPFGADPELGIPLPTGPPRAGTLVLDGSTVRLVPSAGVEMTVGGEKVTDRVLRDDSGDDPDVVELGRLRLHVIRRGDRFGLRVKDPESPTRLAFTGLDWYPVDPAYRVTARFESYDTPRPVQLATSAGVVEDMLIPGRLAFKLNGADRTLEALIHRPGETELFIIFRDETSGTETYGAGRYLYATLEDGKAVVDFNRAYNPPCAFTSYATCPLPPRGNRLATAVRAGEKRPADH